MCISLLLPLFCVFSPLATLSYPYDHPGGFSPVRLLNDYFVITPPWTQWVLMDPTRLLLLRPALIWSINETPASADNSVATAATTTVANSAVTRIHSLTLGAPVWVHFLPFLPSGALNCAGLPHVAADSAMFCWVDLR